MRKILLAWATVIALLSTAGTAFAEDVQLGPGDVLRISVFGNPDLNLETRITESGNISYPLIGDVAVGSLSASEASRRIANLLEQGGFVKRPQVSILVTAVQSQQVSVLGQVNRPGRYPMEGKRSLVDILALAGGISPEGADVAFVIRTVDGKSVKREINLPEIMRSADFDQNLDLRGGDVVYVERAPRFYIYGEVNRPGAYRLEKQMTVLQALSTGGGISMRGTERGVRIKRRNGDGELLEVEAKHADEVRPEDVIYVRESLF